MKVSIAATILLLAIGAVLGWQDRQQLAVFRKTQQQLAAEAAMLGIPSDGGGNPTRSSKRDRSSRTAAVKPTNGRLFELVREMQVLESGPGGNYDVVRLKLLDLLSTLDPAGIEAFLTEARTQPDLSPMTRATLVSSCTTVLVNDHPQAALEIFARAPELFTHDFAGDDHGRGLVLTALNRLAKDNLTAALDWVRDHPQHFAEEAKDRIIATVAEQDPRLAYQLIADMGYESSHYQVQEILASQKTFEGKSAALGGLREYLATIQDEKLRKEATASSIRRLAAGLGREDFESATRWIAAENFTPEELREFSYGLYIHRDRSENGRWIGWLRETVPSTETDRRIEYLISQWTSIDYQAAADWAMTQPPGKDREQILKMIRDHEAGAFKLEHGLK